MDNAVVMLSVAVLVLVLLLVQTAFTYRRATNERNLARARIEDYKRKNLLHSDVILRELDSLFKLRTGLSNALISYAATGQSDQEFRNLSAEYMQACVDTVARILHGVTGTRCAVSIKLFTPEEGSNRLLLRTYFRDVYSATKRAKEYEKIEPYQYRENTVMKFLMESEPRRRFAFHNDLKDKELAYSNPNKNWSKLFSATAAHTVANPDSEDADQMYGFLCTDSSKAVFTEAETGQLLSIVSTAIYYCVYATSTLEALDARDEDA